MTPDPHERCDQTPESDLCADLVRMSERLIRLSLEHSRLNDRYTSLLRDQQSELTAMRAVALHEARFRAARIAQAAVEAERHAIAYTVPFLLDVIDALPQQPNNPDVDNLRRLAFIVRQDVMQCRELRPVEADLATMLRHELVTHHHDAVLAWQEMGGREEYPPC